jgi:hypothetical protein
MCVLFSPESKALLRREDERFKADLLLNKEENNETDVIWGIFSLYNDKIIFSYFSFSEYS